MFRSSIFSLVFYINTIIWMIVALPVFFLPRKISFVVVRGWSRSTSWLLKIITGITHEIRGLENLPKEGGYLVASKHQSTWETYTLVPLFQDPIFIIKRELMFIPLFGWYTAKFDMIPVNRKRRGAAMADMLEHAKKAIKQQRQILIFPEGTRKAPGVPPYYKKGIAHLYCDLNVPCIPIALNSGLYWPRRKNRHYPGTIILSILPSIEAGLSENEFLARLEQQIEGESDALLMEATRATRPPPLSQDVLHRIQTMNMD